MMTILRGRALKPALCAAVGAAFLGLGVAEAMADPYSSFRQIDRRNATSSYGWQVAPGYDRPDYDVDPVENTAIDVFRQPPGGNEPEALSRNINEFAGENKPFHNGFFSPLAGVNR